MRFQEAKLSLSWWTLSFRGICLLMTPLFQTVCHIFDHLVRRRRNTSLLPKGWTVTGSMTKLARAAVPPPTGPGQVEVVRQTITGGKGLQTMPEGSTAGSSACSQSFWIFMRCQVWAFICSYPSWKYWQWIQHLLKPRATLVHPLLPFPASVLSFSASFLFMLGCGEVFLRSGAENPWVSWSPYPLPAFWVSLAIT